MNKITGIKTLEYLGLQTVELISAQQLFSPTYVINQGISARLSSKKDNSIDVFLPSIHNCTSKIILKSFYEKYNSYYDVFFHETVVPVIIGTVSKYELLGQKYFIIETYKDFVNRKNGIVENRYIFNYFNVNTNYNSKLAKKIYDEVKNLPFESFDIEFVIEDGDVLYTDFYSNDFLKVDLLESVENSNKLY